MTDGLFSCPSPNPTPCLRWIPVGPPECLPRRHFPEGGQVSTMTKNRSQRTSAMPNFDITTLIAHFEVHNRTEGKSPRTVEWYNEVLRLFLDWLTKSGLSTSLDQIGEPEARSFVLHLQQTPSRAGKPLSSHSISNRVRALRAFFSWIAKKGYTEVHVLEDMRPPKTVGRVIEPLKESEVRAILGSINTATVLGARNAALVSLMLDTGLRLSETASLKVDDVYVEDRYVKVLGKGSKERIVAFGAACQRSLVSYYMHFRVEPAHDRIINFFLGIDGYPLSPNGIKSVMVRLGRSAGVPRLHPHLLRHTYATSFLLNGGDVFLLKQNLGHSSLAMVENYVHIASSVAAVRSQSFSPLDRLNVPVDRRFRHSFREGRRKNGMNGRIYPNVGRKRSANGRL